MVHETRAKCANVHTKIILNEQNFDAKHFHGFIITKYVIYLQTLPTLFS